MDKPTVSPKSWHDQSCKGRCLLALNRSLQAVKLTSWCGLVTIKTGVKGRDLGQAKEVGREVLGHYDRRGLRDPCSLHNETTDAKDTSVHRALFFYDPREIDD